MSFGIIIVVMLGFIVFLLVQLGPIFSSSQSEFVSIQLAQDVEKLFDAEREAATKSFTTREQTDWETLSLITAQFRLSADSLLRATERLDIRAQLDSAIADHQSFEAFVSHQHELLRANPAYDARAALQQQDEAMNSISQRLRTIKVMCLPAVLKSLRSFAQRTSDARDGAYYVLILAIAIAGVLALIFARTLTKPIQALKAGTEKVGEGHYETIPISSRDEVADLTRAFNLMSDKLRQLDEMRMQLMSEISHEMRTPLQVIKAGCYSIVHTKDGPVLTQRQRDAVGMISHATNRINSFVNSFLDVAKMEAGLMKFRFEEVNLVEMLTPLVQEAQLIAQTRQIQIEFAADNIPLLQIDKERMSQVFSNLLSNALKYTPNDGHIGVRISATQDCGSAVKSAKGCVKIEVQDSGVGIPEADLKKLFNKFYQAQNTPLVNEKGSGLGLALVKHVSEAHGGSVSVQSQVGVGSTFTVVIPLERA